MELKILAVDCSTKTGWATNATGRLESGVQEFILRRGSSPGFRFLEFTIWLRKLVEATDPQVMIFEQAHHRGGAPTEIGVGMATRVMEAAAAHGCEYRSIHTATLKKFATGKGNAGKDEMVEAAAAHSDGRVIVDDNEADAVLMLAWGLAGFPEAAPKGRP